MTQTLREKLRLMLEALDTGEPEIMVHGSAIKVEDFWKNVIVTRIPKPPETISGTYADGTKWEINAPMREAPTKNGQYFTASTRGEAESTTWDGITFDKLNLDSCNCWRTEADAQAWVDVSRRLRGGV